ncbi:MAG: AraC family transcriptional regulator [Christensenellaceae bacterium]
MFSATSTHSVERIAERCGYWNIEHFIRQFKRETGLTPRQFRMRRES